MVYLNNARAPRDLARLPGFMPGACTGERVGPGTHEVARPLGTSSPNTQERFQGLVARELPLSGPEDVPGPGAYEQATGGVWETSAGSTGMEEPRSSTAGKMHVTRSAFRAQGPRTSPVVLVPGASEFMASTVLENPGPGAYDISRDIRGRPDAQALREPRDLEHKVGVAPDLEPGPDQYSQDKAWCAPSADFSTSVAPRRCEALEASNAAENELLTLWDNPGPGTYNTRKELVKGPQAPFRSGTGRGVSYETASPGPAQYHPDPAQPATPAARRRGAQPSASFASESQRDAGAGKHRAPGPGQYVQPSSPALAGGLARRARNAETPEGGLKYFGVNTPQQLALLRDTDGFPLVGFQSTVVRKAFHVSGDKVSPGQYDCDDSMGRSLISSVRGREGLGKLGVFGTRADRMPATKEHRLDPCTYQQVEVFSSVGNAPAAFSSSGPRLPRGSSEGVLEACPGTYEWRDIGKVDYRSKINRPHTVHLSFGSGADRFGAGAGESLEPGPGAYVPKAMARRRGGVVKSTQSRLGNSLAPDASDGAVGPGAYDLDKSLTKKSFNVSHAAHARATLARSASAAK